MRVGYCEAAPWSFRLDNANHCRSHARQLKHGAAIAQALAQSLGAEARFIECRLAGLHAGLQSGALDIAIGGQGVGELSNDLVRVYASVARHPRHLNDTVRWLSTVHPTVWLLAANDPGWRLHIQNFLIFRRT